MNKKENPNLNTIESESGEKNLTPTKRIQDLFNGLAKEHLIDDPELQQTVLDYYSDTDRLEKEIANVFAGQETDQIEESISNIESRFKDPEEFKSYVANKVEPYQSTTERANSFKRRDARMQNSPVASRAEYELGSYRDSMESQVADAVFTLHNKGYSPFESGMDENASSREQFIGLYDSSISLDEELVSNFKEKGFELYIDELSDRKQIRLNPLNDSPVRSSDWKIAWDELAEQMPEIEREDSQDKRTYTYHQEFRDFQDKIHTEGEDRKKEEVRSIDRLKSKISKLF